MNEAEVLVIGSGAAGLSCALRLAKAGHRVTVVSKTSLQSGSTLWAQGGISAVLDAEDSTENHVHDTLIAGAGLCREDAVRRSAEHTSALQSLMRSSYAVLCLKNKNIISLSSTS